MEFPGVPTYVPAVEEIVRENVHTSTPGSRKIVEQRKTRRFVGGMIKTRLQLDAERERERERDTIGGGDVT